MYNSNPNIIDNLIERIENYRYENKNPCKNYATYANANKAANKFSTDFADLNGYKPINYIVVFNEAWGRWVVGLDIKEFISRQEWRGGFVGIGCEDGFYQI